MARLFKGPSRNIPDSKDHRGRFTCPKCYSKVLWPVKVQDKQVCEDCADGA